jgi:TrmH family RNA methyltransferase
MVEITSSSNNKCKYVKSLSQKKARLKYGEYTVEGKKSVSDALKSDKIVTALYVSETFFENESFDYPENVNLYKVSNGIFEKMCDTKAPQGILAVVKMNLREKLDADLSESYIYCDSINDPGNLGTIIRTADAAGFSAVLLSPDCVDLYSPKTVRSSMGSFFNIDVMTDVTHEKLKEMKEKGFSLFGGALGNNTIDYRNADMTKPSIIIVGNEANGICDEVLEMCQCVKIPILGKAESLNAGVAASILMYELVRQRS